MFVCFRSICKIKCIDRIDRTNCKCSICKQWILNVNKFDFEKAQQGKRNCLNDYLEKLYSLKIKTHAVSNGSVVSVNSWHNVFCWTQKTNFTNHGNIGFKLMIYVCVLCIVYGLVVFWSVLCQKLDCTITTGPSSDCEHFSCIKYFHSTSIIMTYKQ